MKSHHRPLYQIYACGALVFQSRDANTAHEYARLAKIGYNDSQIYENTVYQDTTKTERK